MELITKQKYILISLILSINVLLSVFITIYNNYWYIFICILCLGSFVSSMNVILIISYKCIIKIKKFIKYIKYRKYDSYDITSEDIPKKTMQNISNYISKYIYVLPCYNENELELRNTINSINIQSNVDKYSKILIIICDGKLQSNENNNNENNNMKTNQILTDIIFKNFITYSNKFDNSYKIWSSKWNNLEVYCGIMNGMKFIILIKDHNIGKRDSLTLIRRMLYCYNDNKTNTNTNDTNTTNTNTNDTSKDDTNPDKYNFIAYYNYFSLEFIEFIDNVFDIDINISKVNYIIGTDADTILDMKCATELISTIQNADDNTVGVVGFVDVVKSWNLLVIYQYCEYAFAQCLKRYSQSIITHKISCLSGCVQLIKVCKETCSNKILDEFNRLPLKKENIFNHIRSYASEDRNHMCIIFSIYPYAKTIQNIKAISYTNVPDTLIKFIRQRKRWCAGANCNDLLLISNSKHNKWERFQAIINVMIFTLTIFVFIATIEFIINLVNNPSYLMLILASIMILPAIYSLCIPIFIYNDGIRKHNKMTKMNIVNNTIKKTYLNNILYYYLGFIIYYVFGSILSIIIYFYTFYYLDDLNWNNKLINNNNNNNNNNNKNNNNDNDNDSISNNNINEDDNINNNDNINEDNSNDINDNDSNDINDNFNKCCNILSTCNCIKCYCTFGLFCKITKYKANNNLKSNKKKIQESKIKNNADNDNDNNENNEHLERGMQSIDMSELWDDSHI